MTGLGHQMQWPMSGHMTAGPHHAQGRPNPFSSITSMTGIPRLNGQDAWSAAFTPTNMTSNQFVTTEYHANETATYAYWRLQNQWYNSDMKHDENLVEGLGLFAQAKTREKADALTEAMTWEEVNFAFWHERNQLYKGSPYEFNSKENLNVALWNLNFLGSVRVPGAKGRTQSNFIPSDHVCAAGFAGVGKIKNYWGQTEVGDRLYAKIGYVSVTATNAGAIPDDIMVARNKPNGGAWVLQMDPIKTKQGERFTYDDLFSKPVINGVARYYKNRIIPIGVVKVCDKASNTARVQTKDSTAHYRLGTRDPNSDTFAADFGSEAQLEIIFRR
jgi:hypothetical protein